MLSRFRLLVLSTEESLRLAQQVRETLARHVSCAIWEDSRVFPLSRTAIECLVTAAKTYDAVVIVAVADDIVRIREQLLHQMRDNLIFEMGLFTGALGRENVYCILDRSIADSTRIPTDLAGFMFADFDARKIASDHSNLEQVLQGAVARVTENLLASTSYARARMKRVAIMGATSHDPSQERAMKRFLGLCLERFERHDWGMNSCGTPVILAAAHKFFASRLDRISAPAMSVLTNRIWWYWRLGSAGIDHEPLLFRSFYFEDSSERRITEADQSDAFVILGGRKGTLENAHSLVSDPRFAAASGSKAIIPVGWFGGNGAQIIAAERYANRSRFTIRADLAPVVEKWDDATLMRKADILTDAIHENLRG